MGRQNLFAGHGVAERQGKKPKTIRRARRMEDTGSVSRADVHAMARRIREARPKVEVEVGAYIEVFGGSQAHLSFPVHGSAGGDSRCVMLHKFDGYSVRQEQVFGPVYGNNWRQQMIDAVLKLIDDGTLNHVCTVQTFVDLDD